MVIIIQSGGDVMRAVSDLYNQAVISREQHTRIAGTVKTSGRIYEINDGIVSPGSLSINRKAVNRSSFEYGTAVTSEMNITLIIPDADRYSMYDSVIELYLYTLLSDGTEDEMKLGTWNVSECTKSKKLLAFKCYDNMLRFDEDITEDTVGSVYELLVFACDRCGVELAQTQEVIEALINGQTIVRVLADEVFTYRDLICYLGMITCTFAKIDVNGKLVMQTWSHEPDAELIKRQVLSSKISDFQSIYSGVEARFIADQNYAPYSVNDSTISGLVLDMGDIPIVRGIPEMKNQLLENILADLKQVIYTPSELSIVANPAIEPGDLITIRNANLTDDDVVTLITSMTWNYHGAMKLISAGSNPKLASAKDKSTKQIESIESTVAGKDVIILSYTNASNYEIKQDYVAIVDLSYITVEGCKPVFLMTAQFDLNTDGIVEFALYNGLVAIPHATYSEYYLSGQHFVTIFYPDTASEQERKNLRVLVRAYKQESSLVRNQEAEIATLQNAIEAIKTATDLGNLTYTVVEPDDTEPTVSIATQEVKAIIYAQGISTKAEWDGDLEFTDYVGLVQLRSTKVMDFSDAVIDLLDLPKQTGISENFSLITLRNTSVLGFNESIIFNELIENYIVNTSKAALYSYDSNYVSIENGKFSLSVDSTTEQTVTTNNIDLWDTSITGIESVTVTCTGTPAFAISFDEEITWKMHNGSEWVVLSEEATGMQAGTLEAITPEQWNEEIDNSILMRFTLTNKEDSVTSVLIDFTH